MLIRGFSVREFIILVVLIAALVTGIGVAVGHIQQTQKSTRFHKELEQALVVLQKHYKTEPEIRLDTATVMELGALPSAREGPYFTPWGSKLINTKSGLTFTTLIFEWSGIEKECTAIDTIMRKLRLTGMVSGHASNGEETGGVIGMAASHATGHRNCAAALTGNTLTLEIDLEAE